VLSNTTGAGNGHFRDFQTTAERQFSTGNAIQSQCDNSSGSEYKTWGFGCMMMMMMMMDELTLTWHIVIRLQVHVTDKKESRNSQRVS